MSRKRKHKLYRGKFYTSYPNGGHPALIFRKNKKKNRYDAVIFGTTEGHHRTKLSYPISPNIKQTVVHNRPMRGVRKDFSDKELLGLNINKEDKPVVSLIKRNKPLLSKKYKEKQNKNRDDPQ